VAVQRSSGVGEDSMLVSKCRKGQEALHNEGQTSITSSSKSKALGYGRSQGPISSEKVAVSNGNAAEAGHLWG